MIILIFTEFLHSYFRRLILPFFINFKLIQIKDDITERNRHNIYHFEYELNGL